MSPTLPAAYTPLESLLLFQALRADGFDSLSFQKISRDLQGIPLVTKDKSYDPARLDPDALKDLYLGLLKEEVKRDLDNTPQSNGDHATTNGDTSPGSRKRKVSSPTLPTVRDAAQHAHLIPQLVMRLYARYRENAVTEIRFLERDRDAALAVKTAEDAVTSKPASPSANSVAATQDAANHRDPTQSQTPANNSPSSPRPPTGSNAPTPSQPQPKRYSQAKIDAVMNHGPEPQDEHAGHRRASSNTALPPLSEMAPQSPRFGIPPKYHANHGVQPSPPPGHQPYPAHHSRQNSSAMSSPRVPSASNRASASPRPVLPPPPGMNMPPQTGPLPGSPSMHHGPPPNESTAAAISSAASTLFASAPFPARGGYSYSGSSAETIRTATSSSSSTSLLRTAVSRQSDSISKPSSRTSSTRVPGTAFSRWWLHVAAFPGGPTGPCQNTSSASHCATTGIARPTDPSIWCETAI
jgi:hypothetical protein